MAAAALAAGAGLGVGTAPAQAAIVCNGGLSNTSVPGNLSVPSGNSCVLDNVAVGGNVNVNDAKQFLTHGGSIGGSLSINGITDPVPTSSLLGTRINGGVTVRNVGVGVDDNGEGQFRMGDQEQGPITVGGSTVVSNNPGNIGISDSTFGANVNFTNNTGGDNEIADNTINGRLHCSGNSSFGELDGNTAAAKTGQCA